MFDFVRRSRNPQQPTDAIADALNVDGLLSELDPWGLAVVARRGSFSGRPVRYFRIFSPTQAAAQAVIVSVFSDLDNHPSLVLGSGHVERDGAVVVTRQRDLPSRPASE
jgi:hypothetical protein